MGDIIHDKMRIVDTFESNWQNWDVDDTIEWFKFVIDTKAQVCNAKANDIHGNGDTTIDWEMIRGKLLKFEFCPKKMMCGLNHGFLQHFGVDDDNIRSILIKEIAMLIHT